MGELDQALARVYAQRVRAGREAVPPAPHLDLPPSRPEPAADALAWPPLVHALTRVHGDRFERLADALIAARNASDVRALLFTGCHRAEGRTTLLLTLARTLGRRHGRIALVDADLNGPMVARQLGLRPQVGLDDVIDRGFPLADALIESPADGLTVVPLRAAVGHPRAFVSGPAWATALGRLRRDFELVLIDGGPLFHGLGGATRLPAVDAAVLVRNRTLTDDRDLGRARTALAAGGIPLLGVAETFTAEF